MSIGARARWSVTALAAAAAGALLAGCVTAPTVTSSSPSPSASAAPSATASSRPAAVVCSPIATVSYAPSTTSSYVEGIRKRGYLLVGVSADTRLLGAVNPKDPKDFEGFDIAMAELVAKAVLGDPSRIRFKVISTANRITELTKEVNPADNAAGGVDLVARAFTMNCARWQQVGFSAEYFRAHQGVMVAQGSTVSTDPAKTLDSLSGKKVCAPNGSTSLVNIKQKNALVETVGVANHTDCLVQLQQGKIDAITGDDAILAGFKAQDPTTVVVPNLKLSDEPYGLGVPLKSDFAAYINNVLEQARKDGSWQKAYDTWLRSALQAGTQPVPQYGRT